MKLKDAIERMQDLIHTCDVGIQQHGAYDDLFQKDKDALETVLKKLNELESEEIKMGNKEFIEKCKEIVKNYTEEHLDKSDCMPEFEVFVVWCCKTLQNHKALLSTTLSDGMYYELTYNGDKKELYLDAYKKFENKCIKIESEDK